MKQQLLLSVFSSGAHSSHSLEWTGLGTLQSSSRKPSCYECRRLGTLRTAGREGGVGGGRGDPVPVGWKVLLQWWAHTKSAHLKPQAMNSERCSVQVNSPDLEKELNNNNKKVEDKWVLTRCKIVGFFFVPIKSIRRVQDSLLINSPANFSKVEQMAPRASRAHRKLTPEGLPVKAQKFLSPQDQMLSRNPRLPLPHPQLCSSAAHAQPLWS